MTINRLWRLLATALSFALFGAGALLLGLCWFPLLNLLCREPERRRRWAQRSICYSFRLFLNGMVLLGVMSYRVEGKALLATDAGCLLVANHPSLLDYVLLASLMPRCDCIVKQALWHNPVVRGVVRAAGYLPNVEAEQLLPLCQQKLAAGGVLLIFPEGTRSTPGQPLQLQRGAANIAVRCRADLRLVHLVCRPSTLTKQAPWYQIPACRPHFQVTIREKIAIAPFLQDVAAPAVAARHLTQYLTEALLPPEQA